jgi:hypothetical protein
MAEQVGSSMRVAGLISGATRRPPHDVVLHGGAD